MGKTKDDVFQKFNNLDFHDDGLKSLRVHVPNKRVESTKIEMVFKDDSTGAVKLLSFRGCGNVRYLMDFDVLADNWIAQTEKATWIRDLGRVKKFVRAQIPHWHVQYMPPSPKDKPIRKKLSSIRKYALFRVTFFGGTIEVLARSFSVKRLNKA